MRKTITILATALLASTLAIAQADARGGGGGGGHGGFGGGAHMGGGFGGGAHIGGVGLGAAHIGGIGRVGGVGRFEGSRFAFGEGARTGGIHQHAMHRFGRFYPYYGYGVDCYDWYLSHPADSVSPYGYCG